MRNSFSLSENRVSKPFDFIHCDLWGHYHTLSLLGCHYFFMHVNDFSHATWVYLPKDKSKACKHIVQFCFIVKHQFGTHVKTVRSNNGTLLLKENYKS